MKKGVLYNAITDLLISEDLEGTKGAARPALS
jgi:hypothetical protein